MVEADYSRYDVTTLQAQETAFGYCTTRVALMASVRGVKRVRSRIKVSSSAECFTDGTALQVLGQTLAGVPTSPLVFGRMLTGCPQVETIREAVRSRGAGMLTNLDLSLYASVTAVMAAREICRLVENDVEDRQDSLRVVRMLSRRSFGYAMLAAGVTWGTERPWTEQLSLADITKAERSFASDLRVLLEFPVPPVEAGRIIGPTFPTIEAPPFGSLWAGNSPPSWYGQDGAEPASLSVLDGDSGTDDVGSDVVYFHISTGEASAKVPAVIQRMEMTRRKAGGGLDVPAYVIHAPDLDPALAGEIMAAGAFLLPDSAFSSHEARDPSVFRRRIGKLLPDIHQRDIETKTHEDDWLSTPPFSSPTGGWAVDGSDDGLPAAQRRYQERLAAEALSGY